IVDQDRDRSERLADGGDGPPCRRDVGKIGLLEVDLLAPPRERFRQRPRLRVPDVDEADLGALSGEMPDDRLTDAGAAAGDERRLAFEARIEGAVVFHRLSSS